MKTLPPLTPVLLEDDEDQSPCESSAAKGQDILEIASQKLAQARTEEDIQAARDLLRQVHKTF